MFGIWHYLIHATGREIRKLPVAIESLDELPGKIPQEARDLIGFWFNRAVTAPSKRRSNWARSARYRHMFWGAEIRERFSYASRKNPPLANHRRQLRTGTRYRRALVC